jgi:enoyl-CoA hydratase/carnithine racemase
MPERVRHDGREKAAARDNQPRFRQQHPMIRTRLEGLLYTVALGRPAARNAIPLAGWRQLADAMTSLPPEARVLLIVSDDDTIFSAGADITEFGPLRDDSQARVTFREAMRTGIEALAAARVPTIAAIDGACFGAAVALALACDIRVAGAAARFAVTPAKLGIGYPAEDVARLVAQIGKGQASRMLFSAEPIDAQEAHAIGLVEVLAPSAATTARTLAESIARHPPAAVAGLKRVLADPADPGHAAGFDAAFGTPDFARAYTAFTSRGRTA